MLTGIGVARSRGSWGASRSIVFFDGKPPATPLGSSAPGASMRSVSSFSLVGVPDDDAESDRKAKRSSGARGRRPRQREGVRGGQSPVPTTSPIINSDFLHYF